MQGCVILRIHRKQRVASTWKKIADEDLDRDKPEKSRDRCFAPNEVLSRARAQMIQYRQKIKVLSFNKDCQDFHILQEINLFSQSIPFHLWMFIYYEL